MEKCTKFFRREGESAILLALLVTLQTITKPLGQLVTALIGGAVALAIVPVIRKAPGSHHNEWIEKSQPSGPTSLS